MTQEKDSLITEEQKETQPTSDAKAITRYLLQGDQFPDSVCAMPTPPKKPLPLVFIAERDITGKGIPS